jgi:hypothetical protein
MINREKNPRSILHKASLFSPEGTKRNKDFGFRISEQENNKIRNLKSKIGNGPIAQSRLERTPDKREVVGSIPTRPTTPNSDF